MNRRSWIVLLDFFGILGSGRQEEEKNKNQKENVETERNINNFLTENEKSNYKGWRFLD